MSKSILSKLSIFVLLGSFLLIAKPIFAGCATQQYTVCIGRTNTCECSTHKEVSHCTAIGVCNDTCPQCPGCNYACDAVPNSASSYYNGSSCDYGCCTQISCTCTPSCPSGTSTTISSASCQAGKASCSQSNECSSCTNTGSMCYYPETNTSFVQSNGSTNGPSSISMIVDGVTFALSTDPDNPTIINLPCSSGGTYNAKVTVPTFTAPTTASSGGYYFQANNYGINNEWSSFACNNSEDFCIDGGTSNTKDFVPYSKTVDLVLKEGATGMISSQYYTVNKCDTGKKYSVARVGYYKVETNTPVAKPTSMKMYVDNISYDLSTTSSNPTIIKAPSLVDGTAQLWEPAISIPSYSKTRGYAFRADNYGLNNEWKGWVGCNGEVGEDFCMESTTTNKQNFVPATKSLTEVLQPKAQGTTYASYYTTNRCGNNKQYSTALSTYYKVDSIPACVNDCADILPNAGIDTTSRGCKSSQYTGTDVNNPLHFRATLTDENDVNDIQGLIVWLSKDTSVPSSATISGTAPVTIDVLNDIGILIMRNGASWTLNTPNVYGYDGTWKQTNYTGNKGPLLNDENENALYVEDVQTSTDGTSITIDFKLEVMSDVNTKPLGTYNLYALGLDSYMINGTTVDQSRITQCRTWGFDLVDPTVSSFSQLIKSPTQTDLSWKVSDTDSGITKTLLSPYRVGNFKSETLSLYTTPPGYTVKKEPDITPVTISDNTDTIGKYTGEGSWAFISTTEETNRLDIGKNESGGINVYVTTYDKACNYDTEELKIDLNPWFTTRGGTIYSRGSVYTSPKDISALSSLNNLTNKDTTNGNADLTTELLTSGNLVISNLIHSSDTGAVTASYMYDSNNLKNYWFENLISRFNLRSSQFTQFTSLDKGKTSSDCPTGDNCYIYSTEDISIPNGYVCDKNTLIVSDHDIFIDPDITSDNTKLSGCIFLAKNNIHIEDGGYKSKEYSSPQYDYLDGFLIADNQIIFDLTDIGESLRDGIEIYGGMIALGSNISSPEKAIQMNRNLRLYSQTNPTVVQSYNNKFAAISQIFFGSEAPIYKQEVGFKAF